MTPAEVLLKERRDDLRSSDEGGYFVALADYPAPTGNVRTTVEHLLDMAYDALWQDEDEHADILTARAHVDAAIRLLTTYEARLGRLDEICEEEILLAAGGVKSERGDWTMPEGWGKPQGESA